MLPCRHILLYHVPLKPGVSASFMCGCTSVFLHLQACRLTTWLRCPQQEAKVSWRLLDLQWVAISNRSRGWPPRGVAGEKAGMD
jgi:hypothetical protein